MENIKVCSKCGEEKSVDMFGKCKANKDGLKGQCNECYNKYMNEYYKNNKEKWLEVTKNYKDKNADIIKVKNKKYFDRTIEKRANSAKIYKDKNELIIKDKNKKYKIEKKTDAHYKSMRIRDSQLRRSRKQSLPSNFTNKQWEQVKAYFNNSCCYCGEELPLEQEHFIALNNQGGYTKENIVPACRSCNGSKYDTYFEEWYPTHESYNKEREAKILEYLNYQKEDIEQLTPAI